jgi:hypothetical protein
MSVHNCSLWQTTTLDSGCSARAADTSDAAPSLSLLSAGSIFQRAAQDGDGIERVDNIAHRQPARLLGRHRLHLRSIGLLRLIEVGAANGKTAAYAL